jgi:hypothetical protein
MTPKQKKRCLTPINEVINRLYDQNKIRQMKEINSGKWMPTNKLVTGKPQIIGKD